MQLSHETRTDHRAIECSETFEWRCNAVRKDVEKHLETLIPQHFGNRFTAENGVKGVRVWRVA